MRALLLSLLFLFPASVARAEPDPDPGPEESPADPTPEAPEADAEPALEPGAEPAVDSAPADLSALYRAVRPGVVRIRRPHGAGSGFLVEDGTVVVTALHVVEGGGEVVVASEDGSEATAEIIGWDRKQDLAVLRIPEALPGTAPLTLLPAGAQPEVGDSVALLGHPLLLRDRPDEKMNEGLLAWSLTAGVVSSVGEHRIQTTASAQPGNSGGPMLDAHGRVVGVVIVRLGDFGVAARMDRVHELLARDEPMKPPPALDVSIRLAPHLVGSPFEDPSRRTWLGFQGGFDLTIDRRLRVGLDLRYSGLVSKEERAAGRKANRMDLLGRVGPVFDLPHRARGLGALSVSPYFVGGASMRSEGTDVGTLRLTDPDCDPARQDCDVRLTTGTDWSRTWTPYLGGGLEFDFGPYFLGVEVGTNPLEAQKNLNVMGVLGIRF